MHDDHPIDVEMSCATFYGVLALGFVICMLAVVGAVTIVRWIS